MSVIRPKPPEDPLHYDPAGLEAAAGLPAAGLDRWAEPLVRVRDAVLASPGPGLPERLLIDYTTAGDGTADSGRAASELFAILRTARRVREAVDRVIVVGGGAAAARAVVDACCHPCHSELSRGERGGRPRLSFAPPLVDNDALQALLDLVAPAGAARSDDLLDQWGIVALDGSDADGSDADGSDADGGDADGGTPVGGDADGIDASGPDTIDAACLRVLLATLAAAGGGATPRAAAHAGRFAAVAAAGGPLARQCAAMGCPPDFAVPAGAGGFAALAAAGILPAAIAGVDVVRLLAGGRAMHRRFAEAPAADNPVLRFVAAARMAEERLAMTAGGLAAWSPQLAAVCGWYDTVRPRPRHAAATFRTALLAGEPRRDAVRVPASASHPEPAAMPWPGRHARSVAAARASAVADAATPATILLPRIDEHAVGQLFMMLLLAARVAAATAGSAASAGPGPRV